MTVTLVMLAGANKRLLNVASPINTRYNPGPR